MATICVALMCLVSFALSRGVKTPSPIVVPPSQYWDGNDGPWSSFGIQVGTPPQSVRVLPATAGSSVWVVVPEGCTQRDGPRCGDERGFLFLSNRSTSWYEEGLYGLPLDDIQTLGYSGNGDFGFDQVQLSWPGQNGTTLEHQVVTGIATKDFYLGRLGLSPRPLNISNFNDEEPSLLSTLVTENEIPSASWGYTAGAFYRLRQPFGSLTLGGYDAARFTPNNVTFGFGADTSKSLLVGIQSIVTSNGDDLLPSGIIVVIDSTVPDMWVPHESCQKFEHAFGLVQDSSSGLYLVNDTWHDALIARNVSMTFTLGPKVDGGETVEISIPYASVDLNMSFPETNLSSRYFPLRCAENDTQYTLGRFFLQESYLIVDYTRSNFSISQSVFPDTNSLSEHIIPIFPPGSLSKHHLSRSVIIGIILAPLLILAMSLLFYLLINRRRRRTVLESSDGRFMELPATREVTELEPIGIILEVSGIDVSLEMEGEGRHEPPPVGLYELSSENLHERQE